MNDVEIKKDLTNRIRENKYSLQWMSNWLIDVFGKTNPTSKFYNRYKKAALITFVVYFVLASLIIFHQNFVTGLSSLYLMVLWVICIIVSIAPILIVGILEIRNRKQYNYDDDIFTKIIGSPTKEEQILIDNIISYIKNNNKKITSQFEKTIDSISNILVWIGNICITLYFAIQKDNSSEIIFWIFIVGLAISLFGLLIRFIPRFLYKKMFVIDLLINKYLNWKFNFDLKMNISTEISIKNNRTNSKKANKGKKPRSSKSKK